MERFNWKQTTFGLTHQEKIKAAKKFVERKMALVKEEGVTNFVDVAHSYGGHMVAIASQMLGVLFERAKEEETKNIAKGLLANLSEKLKDLLKDSSELFDKCCDELWEKYKDDITTIVSNKGHIGFIKQAFILGSPLWYDGEPEPFNMFEYNLEVIGSVYNCYSVGDLVQNIAGDQLLPEEATDTGRAFNLRFKVEESGRFTKISKLFSYFARLLHQPTHFEMYSKPVVSDLLTIPSLVEAAAENNPTFFQSCDGGSIEFFNEVGKLPEFTLQEPGQGVITEVV